MRVPLAKIAALLLLLPLTAGAIGVQVIIDGQTVTFIDVPQSAWFAVSVREAAEAGIVNGYKDDRGRLTGMFGPGNSITVAEALKIAVGGAGYDEELYGSLVNSGVRNHWASPYVAVAKAEGFEVIRSSTRLDRPATRGEVAALLTSAFNLPTADVPLDSRYRDVHIDTDYAASIHVLSRDGIVSGDTNTQGELIGRFRPTDNINRAEVVKMIMGARATYGEPGRNKRPPEATSDTVSYMDTGFTPAVLRVQLATAVSFKNDSGEPMWVASSPHPVHTGYPNFDAGRAMRQGETYIFTFTRIGSFGYHNHLRPSQMGTIIVEE